MMTGGGSWEGLQEAGPGNKEALSTCSTITKVRQENHSVLRKSVGLLRFINVYKSS